MISLFELVNRMDDFLRSSVLVTVALYAYLVCVLWDASSSRRLRYPSLTETCKTVTVENGLEEVLVRQGRIRCRYLNSNLDHPVG